ncbi:PadR family transcriptional regulator [Bifidobacterium vespertilionis]|uniref:PadR family transcriptional regulator n=1 Tax=Bifidobacterium vespertilionis TaxID=2562524 RepID=UPI001BDDB7FC|nr:PadR family transcriptional regulator [Bifidobacterium vespertilionis]MBT1179857.1 PadR family transcriptional regulator [Bifidobacterium vespertilionis]
MASNAVFGHGQMRLYLLTLLAEGPKHGYELMQSIERRFNGAYVPSAGTIYPRLAKLTEEGLITKSEAGRKTIYAITDAGLAELESRRDEADRLEAEIDMSARALADGLRSRMHSSMGSLKDDLNAAIGRPMDRGSVRLRPVSPNKPASQSAQPVQPVQPIQPVQTTRPARFSSAPVPAPAETDELRRAERLVYEFGLDVRDVLRSADAAGLLDDAAVHRVADELARARDAIRSAI